jgi:hypothetical protein
MPLILKPSVTVNNIQIQADPNNPNQTDSILNNWGPNMPVISINDYVLSSGEAIAFDINIRFNQIPTFSITVNDLNYTVRKALNKTIIDTGVIFIGYRQWYIKFNALMTIVESDAGDHNITIMGTMYNPDLHQTYQKGYNSQTVTDILTDVCKMSNMGLFTVDGPKLSQQLDTCINPNMRALNFFNDVIVRYTNCLWCADPMYIMHVVDWEQIYNQPFDKYTIGPDGKQLAAPLDMVFSTALWPGATDTTTDIDANKLRVKWFTINTNFGQAHISNYLNYSTFFEGQGTVEVDTDTTDMIGLGDRTANQFYGFQGKYFPHYPEIINKLIAGKSIKAYMENIVYELTPFSVINFEAWLPKQNNNPTVMDIDNSGKKVVIGYSYTFDKRSTTTEYPVVRQSIDLI